MEEKEAYAFATTGMIIIRNFYNQEIVDRMRRATDDQPNSLYFHKDPEIFMEFMSHQWIMDCCTRLIGLWFRFDHELAVTQTTESQPYLHGGQFGSQGTCFHHPVGKYSWNGQLTVGLCLTKQNQETGGFSYVPGSHHCISGGQFGNQQDVWIDFFDDPEMVKTPTLNPGDLYVFTEALAHGQRKWSCAEPRHTLYLKYVPGYMAWQDYEITEAYLQYAMTPLQEALLDRPYVRDGNYASKDFRKSIRKSSLS